MKKNIELVAEFYGIHRNIMNPDQWVVPYKLTGHDIFYETYQLEFDKSWDWLMPVVEKIESLGFATRIIDNGLCIDSDSIIIERWRKSKLHGTYLTVVEFIKWYNPIDLNKLYRNR